jgi:hypothetical protein
MAVTSWEGHSGMLDGSPALSDDTPRIMRVDHKEIEDEDAVVDTAQERLPTAHELSQTTSWISVQAEKVEGLPPSLRCDPELPP